MLHLNYRKVKWFELAFAEVVEKRMSIAKVEMQFHYDTQAAAVVAVEVLDLMN